MVVITKKISFDLRRKNLKKDNKTTFRPPYSPKNIPYLMGILYIGHTTSNYEKSYHLSKSIRTIIKPIARKETYSKIMTSYNLMR